MFKKMMATVAICSVVMVVAGCGSSVTVADPCFENLPAGWKVTSSDAIDSSQTAAMSSKLGATIKTLSNTKLVVDGVNIQVNILEGDTPEDAEKLHAAISAMKGDPAACILQGLKVVEFVGDNTLTVDVMKKVAAQLGF